MGTGNEETRRSSCQEKSSGKRENEYSIREVIALLHMEIPEINKLCDSGKLNPRKDGELRTSPRYFLKDEVDALAPDDKVDEKREMYNPLFDFEDVLEVIQSKSNPPLNGKIGTFEKAVNGLLYGTWGNETLNPMTDSFRIYKKENLAWQLPNYKEVVPAKRGRKKKN